jgi:TPR repeat protein
MDEQLEASARGGDPVAQRKLGVCYLKGDGVQKDVEEGIKWIRMAAQQDEVVAQRIMGNRYLRGIGVQKDLSEALKWIRSAADKGDSIAQNLLGNCLGTGEGITKDLEQAAEWFEKSARRGNIPSLVALGRLYLYGQGVVEDHDIAFKLLTRAADRGDLAGYHFLGLLWEMESGMKALETAMGHFNHAASNGYLRSQVYLAKYHSQCGRDETAAQWYTKAAEQGHPESQYTLGCLYRKGSGVPKDETQSMFWYQKAAGNGDPSAQNTLAICYDLGKGLEADVTQAMYWYQKAADQGNSQALITLAEKYHAGDGVEQNFGLAMNYYLKASQLGGMNSAMAEYKIGLLYEGGMGVPKNLPEAVRWYKKSASKGLVYAISKISVFEKSGSLDIADEVKSLHESILRTLENHINPEFTGWEFLKAFEKFNVINIADFSWEEFAIATSLLDSKLGWDTMEAPAVQIEKVKRSVPAPAWVRASIVRAACNQRYDLWPEIHEWEKDVAKLNFEQKHPLFFFHRSIPEAVIYMIVEEFIELLDKGLDAEKALQILKESSHEWPLPDNVTAPDVTKVDNAFDLIELFDCAMIPKRDVRRSYELAIYIEVIMQLYGRDEFLIDTTRGHSFISNFVSPVLDKKNDSDAALEFQKPTQATNNHFQTQESIPHLDEESLELQHNARILNTIGGGDCYIGDPQSSVRMPH